MTIRDRIFEWISGAAYAVTQVMTLPVIALAHGFITAIRDCMEMAND